ncbi:MAG: ECF transporter S component [Clostridiales bacterium]|nr:ECF transporter S component [Clostridiales bacterium]
MNGKTVSRRSRAIRRMVVTAMLGAITALLAFTPVGMITLPPPLPAVTLVHIPVILAALVEGPLVGVPVGLIFGLCSLIRAWGAGMVGLTLFFRDPLVSVLPRMIIPLTAWGAYTLWTRLLGNRGMTDKAGAALAAALGALTNTVLCLGAIVLLYGGALTELVNNLVGLGKADAAYLDGAGAWLVTAVGVPNGLAEAVVAAILVPMVKTAVDALNRRGRGKRPAGAGMGASQPEQAAATATAPSGARQPEQAAATAAAPSGASQPEQAAATATATSGARQPEQAAATAAAPSGAQQPEQGSRTPPETPVA